MQLTILIGFFKRKVEKVLCLQVTHFRGENVGVNKFTLLISNESCSVMSMKHFKINKFNKKNNKTSY